MEQPAPTPMEDITVFVLTVGLVPIALRTLTIVPLQLVSMEPLASTESVVFTADVLLERLDYCVI